MSDDGSLPDIGLYDSATGEDLSTLKVVDVTDWQTRGNFAALLFTQAKRGRIVQLRSDGVRIHYFLDEPGGKDLMWEDCARFGFARGDLYNLALRHAPEPIHIPEVRT